MLILYILIITVILHSAFADLSHAIACENYPMHLECVTGKVLSIKSANYGRTNGATCHHSAMHNRNCYAGSSMNIVSNTCNGKRTCSVYAVNSLFGDPCVGTYKYLDVHYECVSAQACKADEFQCYDGSCIPESLVWNGFKDCSNGEDEKGSDYESEFACEGHTLDINCRRGEVISVINANYGRLNRKHCVHSAMANTNCKTGNSLDVVRNRCNLKPSCSIGSNNGVFGDPCVGTYKYTEIHYQCIQLPACTENEFRCNVGHCIDSSKRCNGHRDCEYGEDEHGCEYLTEFACEHSTLKLECPVGDTITIIGANYGRQERNICTHQSNTNCLSSNSKKRVEDRCNGQRTCVVGATNGEFGDPCVGTIKYLSVHYECRGIHGNEKIPDAV